VVIVIGLNDIFLVDGLVAIAVWDVIDIVKPIAVEGIDGAGKRLTEVQSGGVGDGFSRPIAIGVGVIQTRILAGGRIDTHVFVCFCIDGAGRKFQIGLGEVVRLRDLASHVAIEIRGGSAAVIAVIVRAVIRLGAGIVGETRDVFAKVESMTVLVRARAIADIVAAAMADKRSLRGDRPSIHDDFGVGGGVITIAAHQAEINSVTIEMATEESDINVVVGRGGSRGIERP